MTKKHHLYFILALFFLFACSRSKENGGTLPAEKSLQMQMVMDSVDALAPTAMQMTDSMLATASDSMSYYEYYVLKGRLFLHSSHPDSAIIYYRRTREYAERQPACKRRNGLLSIAYNSEAAYCHLMRKDEDKVITMYKKAYELAQQSDRIEFLPEIAANLADAYIQDADLPTGASYYRKALFLVDSLRLPETKNITLYMGLGQIYTTLQEYDTALHYYQLTNQLYDQMTPTMQSYFLNNYGNCYYFMEDYPQALRLFLRMKRHIETHDGENGFDMYLCKINLADVYLNLNQLDSASKYVADAETFFLKHQVMEGVNYANVIKMGIALRENRLTDVQQLLDNGKVGQELEYNLQAVRTKYLDEYYVRTGNYRKAYENIRQGYALRDSAEHNRQHMQASEIMMRLQQDTLQLHHQLAIEERNAAISQMRTILIATLSALLLLVMTIVVYISNNRKRKLQSSMHILQLKMTNARNRISPHFIFNVLNNNIDAAGHQTPAQSETSLRKLAMLIRQNLDLSGKSYVSLKEEMDFVHKYIEVERPLMGDDFTYTTDVPPEDVMESITIPTMMVQILVENSFVHALKGKKGAKHLTIKATHDDEKTVISVEDNGQGFDIRQREGRTTKNGLKIITHTIQFINQHNKVSNRIHFNIENLNTADGNGIQGCIATITIPNNVEYI